MSKIAWKPGALLAPVPLAMVSCGTIEEPNIITIGWTGIINSSPAMTYISVRPSRHSHGIIKESGEFAINLTTAALIRAADFCGMKSGADVDKFQKTHLTPAPASVISAPLIEESPVSLECRVTEIKSLGSHDMFLAEIVGVDVDDRFLNEKGKLVLHKCSLVAYSHGEYFELGKKIGSFGFTVRKRANPKAKRSR
ncbi:MAG: flavin reductase family protein [Acetanaerobacterium sp.]